MAIGADGNAMVVWESLNEDGDYLGVFGTILSSPVPEPSTAAVLLMAALSTAVFRRR